MRSGARDHESVLVACDGISEPLGAGQSPEKEEEEREWQTLAGLERDRVQMTAVTVQRADLAQVADRDAVALEFSHEVVGHGLAQVRTSMKQRDERTAAREPDSCLARRIAP